MVAVEEHCDLDVGETAEVERLAMLVLLMPGEETEETRGGQSARRSAEHHHWPT